MTDTEYISLSEVKVLAVEKLHTHDTWIFCPGLEGMRSVQLIAEKFYQDAAPDEFKQIVFPFDKTGIYGLAFASKRHLTPSVLSAFLRSQLDTSLSDEHLLTAIGLMQADLIVLATPAEAKLLVENFYKWVGLHPTAGH